jgi:hypothetical protein
MSKRTKSQKYNWLKGHRLERYENSLDRLIEGIADPQFVNMRWQKLKQIKHK